ncbi:cadherin-like beta sandwich domain-containing protein [Paenibacillus sp. GCM10023248]|uniref:cadherin-like beta sandwich domain-containing protein n=1 Tax=unclassified Paenibacillus TaxID=185978 RepID=UPI0023796DC7|nr:cadherin-like beta sandwich domain-containing protein [Paenibacillus sp. MAHUQ-63]MDD9269220.1 cadherin-like beta sandwich domain-containing protein [Paenibacillus sp. MAHUQ-63]
MKAARWLITSLTLIIVMLVIPWQARANGDSNADLQSIYQGSGSLSPGFSSGVTEYWVRMRSTDPNYYTAFISSNSSASIAYSMNGSAWTPIGYNVSTGYLSTNRGDNTMQVQVTATDGTTTKTYTIHIYYPQADDAELFTLSLDQGTLSPPFQSAGTSYSATVPYSTSHVALTSVLKDQAATMEVNGIAVSSGTATAPIPLDVGSNTITVVTRSQDTTQSMTYTVDVTRSAPSTNSNLSMLAVTDYELTYPFQPAQTAYYLPELAYAADQIILTPTVSHPNATVEVKANEAAYAAVSSGSPSSPLPLEVGSNVISVKVTAQDGSSKVYTITVKRLNNEAHLSNLTVSPGNLNEQFSSDKPDYTMADVSYSTSSITVTPTAVDPAGAYIRMKNITNPNFIPVTSGYGMSLPLEEGTNTILVEVWAEDTSIRKQYTITVKRRTPSGNSLSGLTASSGNLQFAEQTSAYSITVGQSASSLTVRPVLSADNPDASIRVSLNNGEYSPVQSGTDSDPLYLLPDTPNVIRVLVTAEDGITTRLYTIYVSRAYAPILERWEMEGTQVKLTFSDPLLNAVTDVTYYQIYNGNTPLTVTGIVYAEGAAEVNLTISEQPNPTDQLLFNILAGAVTGSNGETNAPIRFSHVYGTALEQALYRIQSFDHSQDGIQVNEIIQYLISPYGQLDVTGDGQFDRTDVQQLLPHIAPLHGHSYE